MQKQRIGFTTGVFDLFHIGHLNLIRRAREQCDYLIVAVTTDEEAYRVKKKKPIICFEERKAIVEALRYVDRVVPEHDTDKIKAWEKLRFDVIFKGSDWQGSELWKRYEEYFQAKGVDVVYFPYTEGTSSSMLKDVLAKF